MKPLASLFLLTVCLFYGGSVVAGPHDRKVRHLLETEIYSWLNTPEVVDAVRSQNARNSTISQEEVGRLDKQWRAERKGKTDRKLITKVMSNDLSRYLKKVTEESGGLYAEIFVMDNKGLNVGQSKVTSDYWQGDEAKWKNTFLGSTDSLLIDEIEYDESAKRFQIQVSVPIVDPASQKNIGAVTIGLAMKELVLRKVDYAAKSDSLP